MYYDIIKRMQFDEGIFILCLNKYILDSLSKSKLIC